MAFQLAGSSRWQTPSFWAAVVVATILAVSGAVLFANRDQRALGSGGGSLRLKLGGYTLHLTRGQEHPASGVDGSDSLQEQAAEEQQGDERGEAAQAREAQQQHPYQLPKGTLGCELSGYCSAGKVKGGFRGDITTNEALRQLLEVTAYKQEIMFLALGNPEGLWGQMAINLIKSTEALGLYHFFILANQEEACTKLPAAYYYISCAWNSRPIGVTGPDLDDIYGSRWETAARIIRMGYKPLAVDIDAMFHHDPYVFLKHPVLAKYNALFHRDGPDGYGGVNCGVMYWQNAHPSGPATWTAVEHGDRTLRQREGADYLSKEFPGWNMGHTWEQVMWTEMVFSIAIGRPINTLMAELVPNKTQFGELMEVDAVWSKVVCEDVEWPAEWYPVIGQEKSMLCHADNVTVPRLLNDAWWEENRRYFYPKGRGPAAEAFMELVKTASVQPFPDIELPWTPPNPPLPQENFAFLPSWFATLYAFRGSYGFFANEPPAQVVSHLVFLPAESKVWKAYVFKGHNWWHWDVTETYTGNNVLGLPDPKLLMLAPGVQLYTQTEPAFADEVRKLALLAERLGRRLVVPNPPCDSIWVGILDLGPHQQATNLTLWDYQMDGFQVLQFLDRHRPGHSYCHWMRSLTEPCLAVLPAHADAVAFLERSLEPNQAEPSQANTAYHAEWLAAGGRDVEQPAQRIAAASTVDAAAQAAAAFADAPVLFLGALPGWQLPESLAADQAAAEQFDAAVAASAAGAEERQHEQPAEGQGEGREHPAIAAEASQMWEELTKLRAGYQGCSCLQPNTQFAQNEDYLKNRRQLGKPPIEHKPRSEAQQTAPGR